MLVDLFNSFNGNDLGVNLSQMKDSSGQFKLLLEKWGLAGKFSPLEGKNSLVDSKTLSTSKTEKGSLKFKLLQMLTQANDRLKTGSLSKSPGKDHVWGDEARINKKYTDLLKEIEGLPDGFFEKFEQDLNKIGVVINFQEGSFSDWVSKVETFLRKNKGMGDTTPGFFSAEKGKKVLPEQANVPDSQTHNNNTQINSKGLKRTLASLHHAEQSALGGNGQEFEISTQKATEIVQADEHLAKEMMVKHGSQKSAPEWNDVKQTGGQTKHQHGILGKALEQVNQDRAHVKGLDSNQIQHSEMHKVTQKKGPNDTGQHNQQSVEKSPMQSEMAPQRIRPSDSVLERTEVERAQVDVKFRYNKDSSEEQSKIAIQSSRTRVTLKQGPSGRIGTVTTPMAKSAVRIDVQPMKKQDAEGRAVSAAKKDRTEVFPNSKISQKPEIPQKTEITQKPDVNQKPIVTSGKIPTKEKDKYGSQKGPASENESKALRPVTKEGASKTKPAEVKMGTTKGLLNKMFNESSRGVILKTEKTEKPIDSNPMMKVETEFPLKTAQISPNQSSNTARASILKQAFEEIIQSLPHPPKELTLKLDPGHLGQLKIKVSIDMDQVSTQIFADNQKVASILKGSHSDLHNHLKDQGFSLNSFDVHHESSPDQGGSRSFESHAQSFTKGGDSSESVEPSNVSIPENQVISRDAINVTV